MKILIDDAGSFSVRTLSENELAEDKELLAAVTDGDKDVICWDEEEKSFRILTPDYSPGDEEDGTEDIWTVEWAPIREVK